MGADNNSVIFGSDDWLKFADRKFFPSEKYAFEKMGLFGEPSCRIADIGCGSGRIAEKLAANGHFVKAIDVSEGIIRKLLASGRSLKAEYRHGDAARLPYSDREFDHVIFAYNGLSLMMSDADRVRALHELARVLKPGGKVYIGNHNFLGHVYKRLRRPSWRSVRELARLFLTREVRGELRYRPVSEGLLKRWMQSAGFEKIEVIYTSARKRPSWLASLLTKDIAWIATNTKRIVPILLTLWTEGIDLEEADRIGSLALSLLNEGPALLTLQFFS